MTTITALPTPPSRTDPTNFATRADAFLGALPAFATEANLVAGEVNTAKTNAETAATTATTQAAAAAASAAAAINAPGTSATSTSSIFNSTGSKSFTLAQTGKAFAIGQFVIIAYTTDPLQAYMQGQITAFNSGTGAITVNAIVSEGDVDTFSAWTISLTIISGGVVSVNGNTGALTGYVDETSVQTVENKTINTSTINDPVVQDGTFTAPVLSDALLSFPVINQPIIREDVQEYFASDIVLAGATVLYTGNIDMTLPASPTDGDVIKFISTGYYPTARIMRNGKSINGAAEDLTLDTVYARCTLVYKGNAVLSWFVVTN